MVGKGLEEGWVHSLLLRCTKMSFVYVEQMKTKALTNKVPTANKTNRKPTHMIQCWWWTPSWHLHAVDGDSLFQYVF